MNRRRFLRVGAVGALASTAGCSMAIFGTNQGRVVKKAVRAGSDGKRLITATPSGVSAVDGYPGNANSGKVSITDETLDRLSKSYGKVTYEVTVHHYRSAWPNHANAGERKRYTTYREVFNQIGVGDSITFQPKPTDTSSISSISCIAADRESLSARCSFGDDKNEGNGETDTTGGNGGSSR